MTKITRRKFLAASGVTVVGAAAIGGPRYTFAAPGSPETGDTCVVIHLRGGADGVQMAGPINLPGFNERAPVAPQNPLPLDQNSLPGGTFDHEHLHLHPEMAALYEGLWSDGKMAVISACGVNGEGVPQNQIQSHFNCEVMSEGGSQNFERHRDEKIGWLARGVNAQDSPDAIGSIDKAGSNSVAVRNGTKKVTVSDLEKVSSGDSLEGFRDGDRAMVALQQMFEAGGADDLIKQNGRAGLDAIAALEEVSLDNLEGDYPNRGGGGFSQALKEVAAVLKAGIGLQAAAIDLTGWDHHGNIAPQFAQNVATLAQGIQALAADTNGLEEVTVYVTTEFGRTFRPNGGRGTDHGRGATHIVCGAGINGGVYGEYPTTLSTDMGGEIRNSLPVLNDHREVIAEILTARMDVPAGAVNDVLPGFTPQNPLGFAS